MKIHKNKHASVRTHKYISPEIYEQIAGHKIINAVRCKLTSQHGEQPETCPTPLDIEHVLQWFEELGDSFNQGTIRYDDGSKIIISEGYQLSYIAPTDDFIPRSTDLWQLIDPDTWCQVRNKKVTNVVRAVGPGGMCSHRNTYDPPEYIENALPWLAEFGSAVKACNVHFEDGSHLRFLFDQPAKYVPPRST